MLIKLYTTHCPACDIIESLLKEKGLKYETIDDAAIVSSLAKENSITHIPFAEIDGKLYSSIELRDYINKEDR